MKEIHKMFTQYLQISKTFKETRAMYQYLQIEEVAFLFQCKSLVIVSVALDSCACKTIFCVITRHLPLTQSINILNYH